MLSFIAYVIGMAAIAGIILHDSRTRRKQRAEIVAGIRKRGPK